MPSRYSSIFFAALRPGRRTDCSILRSSPSSRVDLDLAHRYPARRGSSRRERSSRDRAGCDPRSRSRAPRRGPSRAGRGCRISAVGVIGVAGTVLVRDLGIVLRARVHVLDQERDRRSGSQLHAFVIDESTGENLHLVRLAPLGYETRLSRLAAIEIGLDVGGRERDARWQPSTTQPIATPWLSPKVVTRNRWPKVLCDIILTRCGSL